MQQSHKLRRTKVTNKRLVTANSSDEEIVAAINAEGEHRHHWRDHDWPAPNSNNTRSWVVPNDIGHSSRKDTSLLKRLREMVKSGLLEERSYRHVRVEFGFQKSRTTYKRGGPRFRVVQK